MTINTTTSSTTSTTTTTTTTIQTDGFHTEEFPCFAYMRSNVSNAHDAQRPTRKVRLSTKVARLPLLNLLQRPRQSTEGGVHKRVGKHVFHHLRSKAGAYLRA